MKEAGEDDSRERNWVDAAIVVSLVAIVALLALPDVLRARKHHFESHAIGALKTIVTAESFFRECDKEQDGNLDYGMLSELSNTSLVDALLGRGTKQGYLFRCTYSYTTSEFLWIAVANPRVPTVTGDRYFETNEAGVIYYTTGGDLPIDTATCEVPYGGYGGGCVPMCK